MFKYIISILISLLIVNGAFAYGDFENGDNKYLIDQANVFGTADILKKDLLSFNKNSQLGIKILTVESLDSIYIIQYCQDLVNDLVETKDNEVILIYDKGNNQINYCQLFNPEGTITDEEIDYILNDLVQPNIDSGKLVFALRLAIQEIGQASRQNILSPDEPVDMELIKKEERNYQIIVLLFTVILFSWLAACLGRTKSWWLGGLIGWGLGLFIWWMSGIWFFMLLLTVVGFFYDYIVSRNYKEYNRCEKGSFWCTLSELESQKKEQEQKKKRKSKTIKKRGPKLKK